MSFFKGGHVSTIFKGKLEICLKKENTLTERFTTLLHELAHLFLGHTGFNKLTNKKSNKRIDLMYRPLAITERELDAETVSFLVANRMGLEKRSSEYLAGYISSEADLDNFSYELVLKAADKIEKIFLNLREKDRSQFNQITLF